MGFFYCMKYQRRCVSAQRICGLSTGQAPTTSDFSYSEYCKSGMKKLNYEDANYINMCEWFFVVKERPVK